MGKPTGFLEYLRQLPADRLALDRIRDWREFHHHLPEPDMLNQAARCMDCGIPFCHTGTLLNGMASGCPIHNLIPEWNDLVYRGLWKDALDRLHKTNNFPEFTGRVCPAPCEGSCVLGINAAPVTIKTIEAAIADRGWAEGWIQPKPPTTRTGKKVAIIGSGPAGLSAAAQLNRAGHSVTVFERADRPGGLLMYGIPNMKLDKEEVLLRRVRQLLDEGVKLETSTNIGADYATEKLLKDFDAVVLCTGATKARDLAVPGRNHKGIHLAMDFLAANTRSLLQRNANKNLISAEGKDVIVIGGGDTGTDCVGSAMRQGCRSVTQIEIMPKPPIERAGDNPWPEWPKIYRMDYGQEEAAAQFGADPRIYLTTIKDFEADGSGHVRAARIVRVKWERNEKGQFVSREIPGSEKTLSSQLVLIAMGFTGPEQPLLDALKIERDSRTNIKASFEQYTTNIKGVFAAGDCRRGQSLVVWAINEGRGAARECDRYLMGQTDLP